MKSWLVVARGASAPLRLVGHLGWVHRQEARAVGQPRERMGGLRERRTRAEISLSSHENHKAPKGVSSLGTLEPPGGSRPTSWSSGRGPLYTETAYRRHYGKPVPRLT